MKHIYILLFCFVCVFGTAQSWKQVGQASNPVTRILVDTTNKMLYIGGGFKYFDSIIVNGIAQWDGVKAYPLGMGRSKDCWDQNCFDLVLLFKYNEQIYIGRISDSIGDITAKGIARWNGHSWMDVGGGISHSKTGASAIPYDGYVHEEKLLIGGTFDQAGNDTIYSVSSWDSIKWRSLYVPPSQPGELHTVTSLSYYKSRLYAAGNFIMHLDGEITHDIAYLEDTTWHSVAGGLKGGLSYVNDMVVFKDELYICGYFQSNAGNVGNKIMRWDGYS